MVNGAFIVALFSCVLRFVWCGVCVRVLFPVRVKISRSLHADLLSDAILIILTSPWYLNYKQPSLWYLLARSSDLRATRLTGVHRDFSMLYIRADVCFQSSSHSLLGILDLENYSSVFYVLYICGLIYVLNSYTIYFI